MIEELKQIDGADVWSYKYKNDPHNANLLEYIITIGDKYFPVVTTEDGATNFDFQPSHICDQFAHRYLSNIIALPKNASNHYLDDCELMAMLEYYGLDVSKFWYYSVWALDYVLNLNSQTIDNASDDFYKILNAIEQTTLDEYNTKDEATLTIEIIKNGKKQKLITENRFTISAIYYGMKLLENTKPFSVGTDIWNNIFYSSARPICFNSLELKETYQVYYFRKIMMLLLEDYKKARNQKKGKISTSKDFLISKMVYVFKLSKNENYKSDSTFLRSNIKNVNVERFDPVNFVYSF